MSTYLVVRSVSGWQPHHHVGQVSTLLLVLLGLVYFASTRCGNCRRYGKGDTATRAGLKRPAYRGCSVLYDVQGR